MDKKFSQDADIALIAATVHELKTPLTLIHGMSAMLESETFGELNFKQREQIRHISKASKRLGFLIESLLHIENLPHSHHLQPVQLQSELQMAIASIEEKAAEREIVLSYRHRRLPPVLADPVSIYQMLVHILATSIRYSPAGSAVTITSGRSQDQVWVKVRDLGAGVSSKEISSIISSFGKMRQPIRAHSDSTGLSLYIIKTIVEFYGGTLKSSSHGKGSTLTVSLPISSQLALFEST